MSEIIDVIMYADTSVDLIHNSYNPINNTTQDIKKRAMIGLTMREYEEYMNKSVEGKKRFMQNKLNEIFSNQ